jgi:HEAT repeat protein
MTSLTLAAAQLADDRELVKRVLRWLVDDTQRSDRSLLWWAAFQEADWEMPYWAMQGLEHLGEKSQAWTDRLQAMSQSLHPFLRLQACGALARRGEQEGMEAITRAATEDKYPCIRGEAIRVLGQLGSAEHLELIHRALWAKGPVYTPEHCASEAFVPAAEEAALALGRIGTTEAMTALIQGFLYLPEPPPLGWARDATGDALETLVARMDGEDGSFTTMSSNGWRWAYFKPWPEPSFKLSE